MEKKLPKVFANKIKKEINNNEKVYTSIEERSKEESMIKNPEEKKPSNKQIKTSNKQIKTINQKINEIINTKKYIYKIPVKIITQEQELKTKIIGKNNKNIITIDNQLIEINKIKEIYIDEEN